MRTDEPCKQCNNIDYYIKGEFAYCRFCHNEAQKRYLQNKRMGIGYEQKKAKPKALEELLKIRRSHESDKKVCPRNHAYSGDNVRIEATKKGYQRRCRACERDAKRVRYGLTPGPDPVRLADMLDSSEE